MATSQSIQLDEPSYPSYRELQSDRVHAIVSPEVTQRLFWPFDGVFPTCISIMNTPNSPDSLEPYFQPDTTSGCTGTWHEISQLPLTEPKISSIKVSVYELDLWEEMWLDQHRGHTGSGAEYVMYGDLSDDERPYPKEMKEDGGWESDSDTEYLVRCCDEDRPPNSENAATLVVKPSADNGFVTVHDYISAVHPWLMSFREYILTAKRVGLYYPPSLPTELMVTTLPSILMIEDKKSWILQMRVAQRLSPDRLGNIVFILSCESNSKRVINTLRSSFKQTG